MAAVNKGYDPGVLNEYREKMNKKKQNYLIEESDDNSKDYVHFYFIGTYEDKEVIYDAVIYTLRLHHNSELYEIAEHRAAKHFPEFKRITYEEDENGDLQALDDLEEEIGLYMAEVIMELEDEGEVMVKEHVEIDPHIDFGIGLDVALNVNKVTSTVISTFINKYNDNTLELDEMSYTFHGQDEEVM